MRIHEVVKPKSDRIVYHAGTYSEGEYNPLMIGEPGDIRPMGRGIYAASSKEWAARYLKYVPNSTVKKFKVSQNAKLYPWGNQAWKSVSTLEQENWRDISSRVQKEFEKRKLVGKSLVNDSFYNWTHAILDRYTDDMRKILVSSGIDGAFTYLPHFIEYVFYDPRVLTLVKD